MWIALWLLKEWILVKKKLPTKKTPNPDKLTDEFSQTFKEKNKQTNSTQTLSENRRGGNTAIHSMSLALPWKQNLIHIIGKESHYKKKKTVG